MKDSSYDEKQKFQSWLKKYVRNTSIILGSLVFLVHSPSIVYKELNKRAANSEKLVDKIHLNQIVQEEKNTFGIDSSYSISTKLYSTPFPLQSYSEFQGGKNHEVVIFSSQATVGVLKHEMYHVARLVHNPRWGERMQRLALENNNPHFVWKNLRYRYIEEPLAALYGAYGIDLAGLERKAKRREKRSTALKKRNQSR